ncbi:MAG: phosphoribosyltransferase [Syntrophales bacterium]|nr:phosphoribosyltransferase [Syntrophales bacterium]
MNSDHTHLVENNVEPQPGTEDQLVPTVFEDFLPWFRDIVTLYRPDFIVAIARGAIKLLQLHGITEKYLSCPILSDSALPFLPNEALARKRILIFDDSLIFGSTMAAVREYVLAREAIPYCCTYVVDRRNFFGETKIPNEFLQPSPHSRLPIDYGHKMWPAEIRVHHDLLVRRLLNSPYHYNMDFPTVQFTLDALAGSTVIRFVNSVCACFGGSKAFDISSADCASKRVYRFTVLMPTPSDELFSNGCASFRPHTKIRLTFAADERIVQMTPIVQLWMPDDFGSHEAPFAELTLNDSWRNLTKPSPTDRYYKQSLFRLLTSFVTTLYLRQVLELLASHLPPDISLATTSFLDGDLKASLGWRNAAILSQMSLREIRVGLFVDGALVPLRGFQPPSDSEQTRLVDLLTSYWQAVPHLRPHPAEVVYEILGKMFLALREVTDTPKNRGKSPTTERINTGLSFESLEHLVIGVCGCPLSADDISVGVDLCVDNGQAVPKVLSSLSGWARHFYSGERSDAIDPLQMKHYYHRAYSDYLATKRSRLMTPFDVHKLSVALKDTLSWLPITTKYYIYGLYAMPSTVEQDLVTWLTDGPNPPLQPFTNSDGATLLRPSPGYRLSPQAAWTREKARSFLDGFGCLATAFARLKPEHKLLVSTCKTHRHTYNAVAYEAHAWSHKGRYNFGQIASLGSVPTGQRRNMADELATQFYWCVQYLVEAQKKWVLFHRNFDATRAKVERVFKHLGGFYLHFWQYELSHSSLGDREPEIDSRFALLMPVIALMRGLTSYTLHLLIKLRAISDAALKNRFETDGQDIRSEPYEWVFGDGLRDAAGRYNGLIDSGRVPGVSLLRTRLPDVLPAATEISAEQEGGGLALVAQCHSELHGVLCAYCPEYRILEGDFPFAPVERHRDRMDGTREILISNAYILTMDIVGSTDSEQTNTMKAAVLSILKCFHRPNLYHEVTGNDGYLVCADEPGILLDICRAVVVEGKSLMRSGSTFAGTRKGLAFGSVLVLIDLEDRNAIMDANIPNVIPAAFGILTGVDSVATEAGEKNSLVAVGKHVVGKFQEVLANCKGPLIVHVETKHYFGDCNVYVIGEN